jgi:2-haloacid dehalogenase
VYNTFLVDADDTLFDFAACCKNALHDAMKECGILEEEGDHARYMAINDLYWGKLEKKEVTHEDLLTRRFYDFLKEKGEDGAKSGELNDAYVKNLSLQCVSFEGAREFLAELKKTGKIYIITNGTASVQKGRFKAFGMANYAEDVFISEEIGFYKPAKEYMDFVVAHIPNFSAKETLIIGDSLTSDIPMSEFYGVDAVWFNKKGKSFTGKIYPAYQSATYEGILKITKK